MSEATLAPLRASRARAAEPNGVAFADACRVWLRVAALSFGGPAGQIAVMHRIIVDEKRWIGEARFLYALSYCTLLPGPEAQQLAIYIGWLMHRTKGGIVAGTLFVLPGIVAIMALSVVYAGWGKVGIVAALFFGLKSAVLAVVLQAVLRVGGRALKNWTMIAVAVVAFVLISVFNLPFPLIILAAGLLGFLGTRSGSTAFQVGCGHVTKGALGDADSLLGEDLPDHAKADRRGALRVAQIAIFFSEMAVVTFGGAYAVLAYVAQHAVGHYHWLYPGEMLDGLGMAETTPGPLIMVTQFVGFMAAYRHPGALPPMVAGALGGLLTTWVTFTPCFLWIFLGAPFIERLRGNAALAGALAAITAAVVGVILNLGVWFALHTWFDRTARLDVLGLGVDVPSLASLDIPAVALSLAAIVAIFRFRVGMVPTLLVSAGLGVALHLAGAL